jgi:hypothetical protein
MTPGLPPPTRWAEGLTLLADGPPLALASGVVIQRLRSAAGTRPTVALRDLTAASGLEHDFEGGVRLRVAPCSREAAQAIALARGAASRAAGLLGLPLRPRPEADRASAPPRQDACPGAESVHIGGDAHTVVVRNRRRRAVHGVMVPDLPCDWPSALSGGLHLGSADSVFVGDRLDIVISVDHVWRSPNGRTGAVFCLHYYAVVTAPPPMPARAVSAGPGCHSPCAHADARAASPSSPERARGRLGGLRISAIDLATARQKLRSTSSPYT